jgi:hypothetical protein
LPRGRTAGRQNAVARTAPRSSVTPEELLEHHDPEIRALANRLRTLVLTVMPGAAEQAYAGWKLIGYRHSGAYFCFVAPKRDVVQLGFEYGVDLHDPSSLLQGKGTQVRHVEVRSASDIDVRRLTPLIRQAAALAVR